MLVIKKLAESNKDHFRKSLAAEEQNAAGEGNPGPEYTYCRLCGKKHDGEETVAFPPDDISAWGHSVCKECFHEWQVRFGTNPPEVVEWVGATCSFEIVEQESGQGFCGGIGKGYRGSEKLEVIGNIYENPELVKERE